MYKRQLPLYVAVSTDTGCFVYSNTTPRSHRIAAQLMDCGIDVAPVNKALFRTKSAVRLAMEARMVAGMERCDAGRVVVMQIPLSLRQELHATDADIEELSALAAQVEGTDCGVTLRELRPGTVKLSLRTGPRVNATEVCRLLGGGGHALSLIHISWSMSVRRDSGICGCIWTRTAAWTFWTARP